MRADLTELIKSLSGFVRNAPFVARRSHRGTNEVIFPHYKTNFNHLIFKNANNCYSWCKNIEWLLSSSDSVEGSNPG